MHTRSSSLTEREGERERGGKKEDGSIYLISVFSISLVRFILYVLPKQTEVIAPLLFLFIFIHSLFFPSFFVNSFRKGFFSFFSFFPL